MNEQNKSNKTIGDKGRAIAVIHSAIPELSEDQLLLLSMVAIQMRNLAEYQRIVAKMTEVK